MTRIIRNISFLFVCISLAVCLTAAPASAKTHKHHKPHHATHLTTRQHPLAQNARVKEAQMHLIDLGYLTERPDGKLGPKTKSALKRFQQDSGFHVSGLLTNETMARLKKLDYQAVFYDMPPQGGNLTQQQPQPVAPDFYATHPDFYGHYDQQYADPMMMSPGIAGNTGANAPMARSQAVYSRFAKVDVAENGQDQAKTYTVTVDGKPLFQSGDQPSVIGISRTYDLGDRDAIIFSTYRAGDPTCVYKHYLFASASGSTDLQEIADCTRSFKAAVKNGSLYIVFPEPDDARVVGATWRYENANLTKL